MKRGYALIYVLLIVLLLTGCISNTPLNQSTPIDEEGYNKVMPEEAQAILDLASLSLPSDAQDIEVVRKDIPGYNYAYTIKFTSSSGSIRDFFSSSFHEGGNGVLGSELTSNSAPLIKEMIVPDVPVGSRFATRSFIPGQNGAPLGQGGYGGLGIVLVAPDYNVAYVGIWSFPS
ncbi:MAG: hypothetical protein LBM23_10820 [Propionibacteriaceae bacterium]|jgi:hypothetical protein|nr:hypothetical protein [Propionibacteriaceae bacterium]